MVIVNLYMAQILGDLRQKFHHKNVNLLMPRLWIITNIYINIIMQFPFITTNQNISQSLALIMCSCI